MARKKKTITQFPIDFPLKVIGRDEDNFEDFVLSIVKRHFPEISKNAVSSRKSKDGNYLAVTVNLLADRKEQLDALYLELSKHERILMAL
ncbi:MAG: YbeD family protein [Omnitrophica WOR_2 bacterium]